MATHDYNLANQTGADFRADLNDVLQAVLTLNSSATEPTTTAAYMLWLDTANGVLKIRNGADDAWVILPLSISADNTVDINGGTIDGISQLTLGSSTSVNSILDEDNLNSDSPTALATQQSIKAYVDSQVTAQDLDFQGDSGGVLSIDLDSEIFTLNGGTGIDTVGSENTVQFNIDSTVVTLVGVQVLTNKSIDADDNTITNLEVDNLKAGVLDIDLDAVSASDDTLASAKAIKTYVDANITAQDLDVTDGTTSIAIDLDSESLSLLGGTGVSSTASGNGVTFAIGQPVGTTDNVEFNQVTGALVGNASTATALATARTIGGTSFDGTANIAVALSATATALATARTIALAGDVTATGVSFDGTGNISLTTTIAANSVALGTDTTGNYVQTITGTANKITVTGSGSESADVTLTLPDDVQIADSLTVAGNLTVNGTLTSLDTTNLDIEDNLFQLNAGLTGSPVNDSGMLINRGDQDNGIFMWDESVDKFTLGLTTADGTSTGNITLASLGTLVANIEGNVTGDLTGTIQTAAQPNITSVGTLTGLTTTGDINFGDNDKAVFGADSDLQIYHDGSSSIITESGTGNLKIQGTNIEFLSATGEDYANFLANGAVRLYYDNALKLATTSTGIDVTGNATFGDNGKAIFGGVGSDLQIYHDGSNSYISDQGTGDLRIWADSPNIATANGNKIFFGNSGAAELYFTGGVKKLATTSTGIDVTGTATMDGLTVDGGATLIGITPLALQRNLTPAGADNGTPALDFKMVTTGTTYVTGARIQGLSDAAWGTGDAPMSLRFYTVADGTSTLLQRMRISNNGDISFYDDSRN
jgi:hypothetical protein